MLTTVLTVMAMVSVLIGFNALYVAGEFAMVSARKTRITHLAGEGNALAKMLQPVLEDHHKLDNYIAASQVGITISSVVLGIYGQQQIAPHITPMVSNLPVGSEVAAAGVSATLVLILLTTLQVILGELVPKTVALRYPERIALWTTLPMRWSAEIILKPLIILLNGSGTLVMRLLRIHQEGGHAHIHSPEEIKHLLRQSHERGVLDEQEHFLLKSAFRFGKLRAGEVVIPRTKMVAADVSSPVNDILQLAATVDYTRIPLYEGDIDHIIGFVHLKELFRLSYEGKDADVRSIVRDIAFVHETTFLDEAWKTLNEQKTYLAIVFDEYGGTVGLITREDLLEELFGEVQDEFDASEALPIKKLDDNQYRVRGDVSMTYLNDSLNLSIETGDAYTVAGFFLNQLGEIPQSGDEVVIDNVYMQANIVKDRAVEEIILTISQAGQESS